MTPLTFHYPPGPMMPPSPDQDYDMCMVSDAIPFSRCVALAGISIAIILLSILWSWRMASSLISPHPPGAVIPVAELGIQVGLFANAGATSPTVSPSGYGWVDRRQGVVRVPVDVAMEIYCERWRQ
jgi:hypothetical protein